jgi:DNA-binding YbaB/EbfC family protein
MEREANKMPETPDLNEILQMAQNAQAELQKAQDNLEKVEVEGAAGGGMVKVRATAKGRVIGVDIAESLLAPSEKSMLEDLVAAAFNDAKGKADAAAAVEMQKMTSTLPLPPAKCRRCSRACRFRPASSCRSSVPRRAVLRHMRSFRGRR